MLCGAREHLAQAKFRNLSTEPCCGSQTIECSGAIAGRDLTMQAKASSQFDVTSPRCWYFQALTLIIVPTVPSWSPSASVGAGAAGRGAATGLVGAFEFDTDNVGATLAEETGAIDMSVPFRSDCCWYSNAVAYPAPQDSGSDILL